MDTKNEYGTRAIQNELLPLLKDFHEFCIEHEIQYSLAYGSLLGAVRHKGFIPWDDDVDVIVTRDNFMKIRQAIVENPRFQWDYLTKASLWIARIRSSDQFSETDYPPMVDIFILDNVPNNKLFAKLKLLAVMFLQGTVKMKPELNRFRFHMKICAYVTYLIGKILPERTKFLMYEKVSQWGNKNETKRISCYNTIFGYMGQTFSYKMIMNYIRCPFEDTELSVMSGYDEFLTVVYGDYMIPPQDKVGHHLHPEYSYSYK